LCLEASFLLIPVAKYVLDHWGRLLEDHEMDQSLLREGLWKDLRNLEGHEMDLSLPREGLWKDPRNLEDHEMDLTNLEGLLIEGFLEMVNWIEVQIWIRP
jgi:hypothetical protein